MKKIELINMKIRNFKGFKEFELIADGKNLTITGENSTGKSSLYDAFMYCLFGKDSHDSAKFEWKPLDEKNNPIHHLETEVTLELSVDGTPVSFSRTTKEKWREEFEGNETTYRVDDIKMTLTKYKKRIEEIIDEDTFKQLTNIYYVAEVMATADCRAFLFDLVGDLSDEEVINSKTELKPLIKILDGRTVDDKRKLLMEESPKIKQDLKEHEVRIDEADRNSIDLSALNQKELEANKAASEAEIEELQTKISSIKNGSEKTNKLSELQTKKAELETLRSKHSIKQNTKVDGLQKGKQEAYEKAMDAQNAFITHESGLQRSLRMIEKAKEDIISKEKDVQSLREDYTAIATEVFLEFDEHKASCQYCGQEYPEEQKSEIREKYEKEKIVFNTKKLMSLESINTKGKNLAGSLTAKKEELVSIENNLVLLEEEKIVLSTERDQAKEEYVKIQQTIKDLQAKAMPFEETKIYQEKIAEMDAISAEIETMAGSVQSDVDAIQNKINVLKANINQINEDLYQFVLAAKQEERKLELIENQKKLANRNGEIKQQINLLNEFVKAKVSLLTEKINSEFKLVTFKLFNILNNGSLEEVCQPLVDGVPFSSGLNTGSRMEAGLDIINTLTRLKGVSVPIFIDNAEGLTNEVTLDSQLIQLKVAEGQTELKIESKEMVGGK